MKEIDDLYGRLDTHIANLEKEFISRFVLPRRSKRIFAASDYSFPVQAYCILCHAAFEEFIEQVALKVVDRAVDEWISLRKTTDAVLALMCHTGRNQPVSEGEDPTDLKVFDYLRPRIEEAKQIFSKQVQANHGVSVKYLRRLLIPVGLDVSANASYHASLAKLADERGSYAHRNAAMSVMSPEDARKHVADCLLLCQSIRDAVSADYPT